MRKIAEKFMGKKLNFFKPYNIHFTSDMVRNLIYSNLQAEIIYANVLFGGKLNFSFECLSKCCKSTVICDKHQISIDIIKKSNLFKENAVLCDGDLSEILNKSSKKDCKFDMIFIKDAYSTNLCEKTIQIIFQKNLLNYKMFLVFEYEKYKNIAYDGYEFSDTKKYEIAKNPFKNPFKVQHA